MNKNKTLTTLFSILAVSFCALPAFAESDAEPVDHPEPFWQPAGNQGAINLTPGYFRDSSRTYTPPTGTSFSTAETKGFDLGVGAQAGLSQNFAIEARTTYLSTTVKNTESSTTKFADYKRTGWSNIEVLLKAYSGGETSKFYFGVLGSISPAKGSDTNFFTGGHSIQPYAALAFTSGQLQIGPRISYQYKFDRKGDVAGTEYSYKGGHNIAPGLFGEYQQGLFAMGLEADYIFTASTDVNYSLPNSNPLLAGTTTQYQEVSYESWLINLYGRLSLTPSLDLIPQFLFNPRVKEEQINGDLTVTSGSTTTKTKLQRNLAESAWTLQAGFRFKI